MLAGLRRRPLSHVILLLYCIRSIAIWLQVGALSNFFRRLLDICQVQLWNRTASSFCAWLSIRIKMRARVQSDDLARNDQSRLLNADLPHMVTTQGLSSVRAALALAPALEHERVDGGGTICA